MKNKIDPISVSNEYKMGTDYKASIGNKGLLEQSRINGRFYVGDHWYGAAFGDQKPLVRRNIIRRICDYKLSAIAAAPIAVRFSAEGIASNIVAAESRKQSYNRILSGEYDFAGEVDELEIGLMTEFLSSHAESTIERLGFNSMSYEALKNACISGTGLIYTYWDENAETGLFADNAKTVPIMGDIASEVIDLENIVFGDPNCDSIEKQPYIIIASRRDFADVRREAKRNGIAEDEILKIVPDEEGGEPHYSCRVTVYTKLYKEYDPEGRRHIVKAVKCTDKAVVKPAFSLGVRLYPIAKLSWDKRYRSIYGESEITYLVPNQIAINRALSAEVWATMVSGMPIMLANGDTVDTDITNDPDQIIKIYGDINDVASAVRYVEPPSFAAQMINSVNDLASNTLSDSGANDAALGNVRPDNAAAIIELREAALQPLQIKQNQFYEFIEDVMRIWAEFWINLYRDRKLKVGTENGVALVPFHPERYRNLLINAKVDVGASTVWSVSATVATLDSLLKSGVITPLQYLERMPDSIIPDKAGLINEFKGNNDYILEATEALEEIKASDPELYKKFEMLSDAEKRDILERWQRDDGQ